MDSASSFSSRRRSPCALAKPATSVVAVVNCAVYPARIASRPSAIAKCVLPTPGRPSSSTFSPLGSSGKRPQVADLLGIDQRLCVEVEVRKLLQGREVCELQRHLDAAVILARDLTLRQQDQRLAVDRFARAASSSKLSNWSRMPKSSIAPAWCRAHRSVLRLLCLRAPSEALSDRCFVFGKRTQQRGRLRRRRHRRCRNLRSADSAIATGNPVEVGGNRQSADGGPAIVSAAQPHACHGGCAPRQPRPSRPHAGRSNARTPSSCWYRPRRRNRCRRCGSVRATIRTRPPAERLQTVRLVTLEASHRRLAGRAVDTHVRHLALPLGKMRLECLPACEGMTRDRVLLRIADAARSCRSCAPYTARRLEDGRPNALRTRRACR